MKKLSIFLAASAMLVLASCEDDKTPVLNTEMDNKVDAFTLNTPAFADQTVNLAEEGTLTLSVFQQPDYGFPGSVNYTLYAAIDPAKLTPQCIEAGDGVAAVPTTSSTTDRVITIKQSDLATLMCSLNGMYDDQTWNPELAEQGQKLYFICEAWLGTQKLPIENSSCFSNVVSINNVTYYKAFKTPVKIWIVGSFSDPAWNVDQGSLYLRDKVVNGENNNVFTGPWRIDENGNEVSASNIPAGSLSWRFYTELSGSWGSDGVLPSIGSGPNDFTSVAVAVPAAGTSVELEAVPGKGNWDIAGWPGGDLTFILDQTVSPWVLQIKAGNVEEEGDTTGEPQTTDFVWIDAPAGWTNVYVWAWNADENCTASGSWPGDRCKFSETQNKYFWEVPAGKGMPANIIVSNGEGDQTNDLEYVNNSTIDVASNLK